MERPSKIHTLTSRSGMQATVFCPRPYEEGKFSWIAEGSFISAALSPLHDTSSGGTALRSAQKWAAMARRLSTWLLSSLQRYPQGTTSCLLPSKAVPMRIALGNARRCL